MIASLLVLQGCAAAHGDESDAGVSSPPPSTHDGDGGVPDDSAGDGDGDGDGSTDDWEEPVLDGESSDPTLAGQGGAYESETPAPRPCVSLLSLGEVDQAAAVPGERGLDSLVSWLNENSSAKATHARDELELAASLLQDYEVVLLQDVSRWQFSQTERDVFEAWIRGGGSVIALSGFTGALSDKFPANELLSFSGLNHTMAQTAQTVAAQCGYCLGETYKQAGWNPEHPIAQGLDLVGAYRGYAVRGEGEVVARQDGQNLGLTKEVGEGRVFLFHDDWVAHTSQWTAVPRLDCQSNPSCVEVTIESTYQMPRFWYNTITWLARGPSCFVVEGLDPE